MTLALCPALLGMLRWLLTRTELEGISKQCLALSACLRAVCSPGLPVKVAEQAAFQSKSTAARALGAQSASPNQQAQLCVDGKVDTWCQTMGTNPWWGVALTKGRTAVFGGASLCEARPLWSRAPDRVQRLSDAVAVLNALSCGCRSRDHSPP